MAKEKSTDPSKKDKKDKKDKKEKRRSEEDGVHKSKKDKKDKKQKTEVLTSQLISAIENQENDAPAEETLKVEEVEKPRLLGALVPFANPLADEKTSKKVFKGVKKAAGAKTLKRGVKEVVKALRKSPTGTGSSSPPAVVVLAADISPMDVISHIPVLCEDHSIPYVYVPSRAELGAASQTKRPTSVVMVTGKRGGKAAKEEGDGDADWKETYDGLVKVVEKEGVRVKI